MRCADFLIYIYTRTKFPSKILFPNESLTQLGMYRAFMAAGDGRRKGKHEGISVCYQPCWWVGVKIKKEQVYSSQLLRGVPAWVGYVP